MNTWISSSQIGAEAYVSVNVGSGTPQEAAEWLEYMTTAQPTTLAKERAANGHPAPYKIALLGIGNESWDCGGNMSPEYYVSQMKIYSHFVRNFNPAQQGKQQMLKIAVGPGGDGPRWTEWTETIMKAYQQHTWSWDINGLSMHNYTVVHWPPSYASVGFGETEYSQILKSTLEMDGLINKHSAIMDKYDPDKKVALVVDEWGGWYAPMPGSNPGFLVQQNSLRDAILAALNLNIFARHADRVRGANIAQMINVLQAMIITDNEKMVLTPTYYVFKMYVPFQDATLVPVTFDAGTIHAWEHRVAARGCDRCERWERQVVDGVHKSRSQSARGNRGKRGRHLCQIRGRRNPDCTQGRQRQHLRRTQYGGAETGFGEYSRR